MSQGMDASECHYQWIGLRTTLGGLIMADAAVSNGVRQPYPVKTGDEGLVPLRGTIRIELAADPKTTPRNLLRLSRRDPIALMLSVRVDPDGTVALILRRGAQDDLVRLDLPGCPAGARMTIQYGWDQDAQLGHFWAEIPSIGASAIKPIPTSIGLSRAELRQIVTDRASCAIADDVDLVAVAEGMVPAGPLPGLDGAGLVERKDGYQVPLDTLASGDEIIAADGAPAQIRWIGAAEVPAFGQQMPYRVNAPYHGARTPLILAGTALLRRKGVEVEYLFGEQEVAVQICQLKDNVAIMPALPEPEALSRPLIRYHQLILDRPVPVRLSGVVVETLDFSTLIRIPDLHLRSILGGLPPELLSREELPRCKILRDYEAKSLRQMQAA